jgi:hypothetical protein
MSRTAIWIASVIFLGAMFLTSAPAFSAGTVMTSTWGGPVGDWTDETKWNPNTNYPGDGAHIYNVVVGTGTVTQDQSVFIQDFTLRDGAVLTDDGSDIVLTCTGAMTWRSGSMLGSGTTHIDIGTLSHLYILDSTADKYLTRKLQIDSSADWNGGNIILSNSAYFQNQGTFSCNIDADIQDTDGSSILENSGTFVKTSGALTTFDGLLHVFNTGLLRVDNGTIRINGPLDNSGTIRVANGTMEINGPIDQFGASVNTLAGGTWIVGAGSTLNTDPVSPLNGMIIVNQGNITLDGQGSTFSAVDSIADNQGSFKVTGGRSFQTAGDLDNNGTLTVGNGSTFTVGGTGKITGQGSIVIEAGGTMTAKSIRADSLVLMGTEDNPAKLILGGGGGGGGSQIAAISASSQVPEPNTGILLFVCGLFILTASFFIARKRQCTMRR